MERTEDGRAMSTKESEGKIARRNKKKRRNQRHSDWFERNKQTKRQMESIDYSSSIPAFQQSDTDRRRSNNAIAER